MKRNRLKIKDLFFVALYGVRARKGRATLTSIGIGIGIAAIANYLINSNWTWRREI